MTNALIDFFIRRPDIPTDTPPADPATCVPDAEQFWALEARVRALEKRPSRVGFVDAAVFGAAVALLLAFVAAAVTLG